MCRSRLTTLRSHRLPPPPLRSISVGQMAHDSEEFIYPLIDHAYGREHESFHVVGKVTMSDVV